MTPEQLRQGALEELAAIAPEVDASGIDPSADLREALGIDSFDFLEFLVRLHDRFGVDVPESDYQHLTTLDGCVAYLGAGLERAPA